MQNQRRFVSLNIHTSTVASSSELNCVCEFMPEGVNGVMNFRSIGSSNAKDRSLLTNTRYDGKGSPQTTTSGSPDRIFILKPFGSSKSKMDSTTLNGHTDAQCVI